MLLKMEFNQSCRIASYYTGVSVIMSTICKLPSHSHLPDQIKNKLTLSHLCLLASTQPSELRGWIVPHCKDSIAIDRVNLSFINLNLHACGCPKICDLLSHGKNKRTSIAPLILQSDGAVINPLPSSFTLLPLGFVTFCSWPLKSSHYVQNRVWFYLFITSMTAYSFWSTLFIKVLSHNIYL